MSSSTYFAERLHFLREKGGLSQSELAKELGVSRGAISFYENGDRVPNIDFLCDAAAYFDVPVEYLLGLRDNLRSLEDSKDLYFLTEEGIASLEECAEYGELLDNILTHKDFSLFFYEYHKWANTEKRKAEIYMENGRYEDVMVLEENVNGLIDTQYMVYRLTQHLSKILEDTARNYAYKGIDKQKGKALQQILDQSRKEIDKLAEETAKLNEQYEKEEYRRLRALEKIHSQEGE